jgi:YidC/Oxa1 family membrane protein insertase
MRDSLVFFYNLTGNHGMAIILLTVVIKLILLPLTISQSKSMLAMKKMQPLQKELQEKYKDNPQILNEKLMELYKKHKVNPFGGCLPLIIQLPFIYALFGVLRTFPAGTSEAFQQAFSPMFLMWDLSLAANMAKAFSYYILPLLSAVTTYIQTMQTSSNDPSQKSMQIFMPLFIGYLSTTFASGLVLYWIVGNLFTIAQTYWLNRRAVGKGGSEAV